MKPLYGFGHTQEDERTEAAALDLPGGNVLSITSAGEMPLNLLALGADEVVAVDIDPNQNHLARLKLATVLTLDRAESIRFLGYMPAEAYMRRRWLDAVLPQLPDATATFWSEHVDAVDDGPIWAGRFEHYLHLALTLTGPILSRPFRRMAECDTLAEQHEVFEEALDRPAIHAIFRLVFSPKTYGGHGLDARALQHHDEGAKPLGERFFDNLRALCENTPAKSNPYLQLFSLGEVLSADVVPTYLTAAGFDAVRERHDALEIVDGDVLEYLRDTPRTFNRFHLSNVTDWMAYDDFRSLLRLIILRSDRPARLVWRAIHAGVDLPEELASEITVDPEWGARLRAVDRFPMYAITPGTLG
jgi:S-adenosylmethionine:diacylglycerol 3-amino-3-carboxypropyl transferase